jgi:hypothetical protein
MLTVTRGHRAEWANGGNIVLISPDDIDAIVKGRQ